VVRSLAQGDRPTARPLIRFTNPEAAPFCRTRQTERNGQKFRFFAKGLI
jgi:hypothetical protein